MRISASTRCLYVVFGYATLRQPATVTRARASTMQLRQAGVTSMKPVDAVKTIGLGVVVLVLLIGMAGQSEAA
jgi:hypothetical protein